MRAAKLILRLIVIVLVAGSLVAGQQNNKALTNQDVISMAKNQLPETVIIEAIKSSDTDFDISASGLIALQKAAVTSKVMEAMIAAVNKKKNAALAAAPPTSIAPSGAPSGAALANGGGAPVTPTAEAAASAAPAWQPTVSGVQGGTILNLKAEATQIAQTKTKLTSLSALAADQALNGTLRVGVHAAQQAAQQEAMKTRSAVGDSAMISGAQVFGGLFGNRQKQDKVVYVWSLMGGTSSVNAADNPPTFEVNYAGIPGVSADQFEPVIVKLTLTPQASFRLVGATEAASNAEQATVRDWPIYSSFVEDRIASHVEKVGTGHARVRPNAVIAPGEYAVAFRPIDKSHKFSGEEVGKNQAEGLLFNYVWSFSVK
jgi:hypothetical protein